jgi:potassium-dependent mechanosensitive channel
MQKIMISAWIAILLICLSASVYAQDSSLYHQQTTKPRLLNPSNWLQHGENAIIQFQSELTLGIDTAYKHEQLVRMSKDLDLITSEFTSHGAVMRIRSLDDVKAKLLQMKVDVEKWRTSVRKQNDLLAANYYSIEQLKVDSIWNEIRSDSAIWGIYEKEFNTLGENVVKTEKQYQEVLKKSVSAENNLNNINFRISNLLLGVEKELAQRSAALFQQSHPPFWKMNSSSYKEGIGEVFMNTLKQNLESLKFYGKNAYIRVILFRIILLLITLLPIWYFKKHKKEFENDNPNQAYKFVHKYTGASTSSFVLVMAPIIFINSPHIFTEVILVTLSITTTLIFLKEQPNLKKSWFYALLGIYIILKAMNLMVSVTYFGRWVWSLSLVGLIPLYYVFRSINLTNLANKWLFRVILVITFILYVLGWFLNFTGHYPLGRILLLAGLEQFFLAIILYVAIYSLIDFFAILANIYNRRNTGTTIRVDIIYNKLLNLVRFLALIFWFNQFLHNINAMEFLRHNFFSLLNQQINVAGYSYAPGSILIFFTTLFITFYISSMLDGLFLDEKRTEELTDKTSLASIVIILRLFIIAAGFILGMAIAGIPLDNLNLFVGALGVGIGFGLQSFFANLISGIIIAFEKPLYVGDIVELEDGTRGRVTDIGLRSTTVDTYDGAEYIIPNNEMIGKVLKNWTLTSKLYKLQLEFNVDHDNDPETVQKIASTAAQQIKEIMPKPAPAAQFLNIRSNGLQFEIACWVKNIAVAKRVKSQLLTTLHKELMAAGVKYPRPTQDKD